MSQRHARERSVLLIEVGDKAARSCAVAASPVRVLRANNVATAESRVHALKPLAVVAGPGLPREQVTRLERVAREAECELVRADDDADDPESEIEARLKPVVLRALGSR
jgi:hypothetical protein